MPVPLHALKRWLSGAESVVSDLESTPEPEAFKPRAEPAPVLRWDGETAELVAVSALRTMEAAGVQRWTRKPRPAGRPCQP